eukprot:SAG11_NODE_30910_length_296_cov_1.055838_1_plen_66_part_01
MTGAPGTVGACARKFVQARHMAERMLIARVDKARIRRKLDPFNRKSADRSIFRHKSSLQQIQCDRH